MNRVSGLSYLKNDVRLQLNNNNFFFFGFEKTPTSRKRIL
jgi:hypothetical protein